MKRVPIHFLPVQVPGSRRSKREKELATANAKAHTARVSYPHKALRSWIVGDTYLALPGSINNGGLDPFIQLATDLSGRDRNLLHSYLTTSPKAVYGTGEDSVFCPVRDFAVPQFSTNQIYIQWHLLLSEKSESAISALRVQIYGAMRQLLEDQSNWFLDSTIFTLAASGIAENRSRSNSGKQHLTAVVQLLGMRQGLRTLQDMEYRDAIPVFCALVMWEKELAVTEVKILRGRLLPESLRRYFEVRELAGGALRAQLANLHCMNGILARVNGTAFLEDLERSLKETMPPHTVLCTIGRYAAKAGYWETNVMRMWEAIEFVEVVSKMAEVQWVMKVMSGWLTGHSGVDMEEVVHVIEKALMERGGHSERAVNTPLLVW